VAAFSAFLAAAVIRCGVVSNEVTQVVIA